MDLLGYLVIGLLAGTVSGWVVGTRSVSGCLPTIVVGVIGALIGGWLAREIVGSAPSGFIGAFVFAVIGSIAVRLVLRALEGND